MADAPIQQAPQATLSDIEEPAAVPTNTTETKVMDDKMPEPPATTVGEAPATENSSGTAAPPAETHPKPAEEPEGPATGNEEPEPMKTTDGTSEETAPAASEKADKESVVDKAKAVVKDAVQDVKDAVKKTDEDKAPEAPPAAEKEEEKAPEPLYAAEETPKDSTMGEASQSAPPNGLSQDVDMADVPVPAPAPVPEGEAVPEPQAGDKRKGDEAGINGSINDQDVPGASEPAEKKSKVEGKSNRTKVEAKSDEKDMDTATTTANGNAPARKRSEKEKVMPPVGGTARGTGSQGLADGA